ncbi:PKD domain-containing protein [Tenacibaculum aestuariivivum]|uniref:PKD domain-containing protein n=1 Tax=Tenacibaculum aestuariivivum TaxID=2006131 RepID=UPI003AB60F36
MNFKNYLSTFCLLVFTMASFGQKATTNSCGTKLSQEEEIKFRQSMSKFKKQQKSSKKRAAIDYKIPVVFHVLHNGKGEAGAVSKENMECRINDVMDVVNKDFRGEFPEWNNTDPRFDNIKTKMENVEFILATEDPDGKLLEVPGMNWLADGDLVDDGYDTRITNDPWWWGKNNKYYLQVFIVASPNGADQGNFASGHAFLPTQNAIPRVVFNWRYLGRATACLDNPSSSQPGFEKIMSHEFGHYFGLKHTFNESNKDNNTCDPINDGISDTPQTIGSEGCSRDVLNACGVYPNVENYMDYNTSCQIMFTSEQVYVMNMWLEDTSEAKYPRSLLWQPSNLIATGITPRSPTADFISDETAICSYDYIYFQDVSTGVPTYRQWTFEGGTPSTSNEIDPTVRYDTPGKFKVTLQVANQIGGDIIEKVNYIDVDQYTNTDTTEKFDGPFPPKGWTISNPDGKLAWEKRDDVGNGDSSCIIMNNADNDVIGEEDYLRLPFYDFSGAARAQLYFDVAYVKFDENSPDILKVEVSTDCGNSWSEVYSKTHLELETTTSALSPNNWVPNKISDWRKEIVNLSAYDNQTNISIRFKNVSGYGTRIWIDNVSVSLKNNEGPTADFYTKTRSSVCNSQEVQFFDTSTGFATQWAWEFPGGTPATSTDQNPVVFYNQAGSYDVTLTATNPDGFTTKSETGFFVLKTPKSESFTEDFSGVFPPADWEIRNFDGKLEFEQGAAGNGDSFCMMMNNADNSTIGELDEIILPSLDLSAGDTDFYFDVAYTKYNHFDPEFDTDAPDKLKVMVSKDCGENWETLYDKTHTDLQTFEVLDDSATDDNEPNDWIPSAPEHWRNERVLLTNYLGEPNVLVKFVNESGYGTRIWIDNVSITTNSQNTPTSNFEKEGDNVCLGNNVQFFDKSSGIPTSWSWAFEGGIPTTSTDQNPVVIYNTPGVYEVTLTASNSIGIGNTITKTAYVTVKSMNTLPYTQNFQGAFPITDWEIINPDNDDIFWEKRSDAGNGDNSCIIINNADNLEDKIDELIISPLDFSASGDKKMEFDVAYTKFTNSYDLTVDAPDNLIVLVSKNCGSTWTEVYNKTHTELETVQVIDDEATPDDNESNDWIPSQASDWRTETIDLNTFSNNPNVLIKFKNISGYGTRIWIDNLSITSTPNIDDNTWTGTTSNDWNTASNWSNNTVPSSNSRVIIPSGLSNYPTVNSNITINTLTINSGASFIAQGTVTGTVTYKRNIPNTDWYLISSPFKDETINNFITNSAHPFALGTGNNIGFAPFNNNSLTNAWDYQTATSTGNFEVAKGYSLKLSTTSDISITGTINDSNVNTQINNGARNDYNLLGNPFTSYVNSVALTSANSLELSEETIWLWDGNGYIAYNEQTPIELAPTQGFFIEANANPSTSSISFATSNQSHQSSDTFKRQVSKTSFELFADNGSNKKSTKVFYAPNKTTGFDNGSDSKIFGGIKSNFELFTQLVSDNKGKKLAIQTLPNENLEEMVIPVGLTNKTGEEIVFSVNAKNLPNGIKIYLEDRITNTFTNISDKDYKAVVESTTNSIGQFYIHTSSKNLENTDIDQNSQNISIYESGNNTITITGLQADKASLNVYSIIGKRILNTEFKSTGVSVIELPKTAKGIYIVEILSNFGKVSKKVILE